MNEWTYAAQQAVAAERRTASLRSLSGSLSPSVVGAPRAAALASQGDRA